MAKTIILIDDDQDDLDIMKDAIEEVDKSILLICFINPEEALSAITNGLIVVNLAPSSKSNPMELITWSCLTSIMKPGTLRARCYKLTTGYYWVWRRRIWNSVPN